MSSYAEVGRGKPESLTGFLLLIFLCWDSPASALSSFMGWQAACLPLLLALSLFPVASFLISR